MQEKSSLALSLALLPESKRLEVLKEISDKEAYELLYDWRFWARPNQLPPSGDWRIWYNRGGRGSGKTRGAAEWVVDQVQNCGRRFVALVNDTMRDVRDTMIEGRSGIVTIAHPNFRPIYEPSKSRVLFPNRAVAMLYAAEAPELIRGPEFDCAWADEPGKWRNLRKQDPDNCTAWDNLMFALRAGDNPQCVVSTTPRSAFTKMIRQKSNVVTTTGTTYENRYNLPEAWFRDIISAYEGTRIGRQELNAEELEDVEGALWNHALIERTRVQKHPELTRVVVAIDPSVTAKNTSDEAGIVVAGIGTDKHGYVLDDLSIRATPERWMQTAIAAYKAHSADRVVAEVNQGGDLVETLLRTVDSTIPYKAVHASKGKQTRAEPVEAMYEQNKIHHVGLFAQLEDEMTNWIPGSASPNRMDALVWAMSELMVNQSEFKILFSA